MVTGLFVVWAENLANAGKCTEVSWHVAGVGLSRLQMFFPSSTTAQFNSD